MLRKIILLGGACIAVATASTSRAFADGSTCVKVLKAIASPILFEQVSEAKPQTRGYGFFVERPKGEDNWASRMWRHYPRQISKMMIGDDNFVFVPLNPFPGRQLVWIYNFITGDWAIRKVSKYFVGASYTISRFVSIPLMIWSFGNIAYHDISPPPDPLEVRETLAAERDYQLLPTDHALIRVPRLTITNDDLRAKIYLDNGGDPRAMQAVYDQYYRSLETQNKSEPKELFARVDELVMQAKRPDLRVRAHEVTHMLLFRLRLLDDLYYFPSVFNAQKKTAIDRHEVELSEFMSKIQLTDNFLQTAKEAYANGRLSEDQLLHFSQQYIYNLYILEMADLLEQNLVKERFGVVSPLNLFDMTVSLKTQMLAAMKPT